MIEVRSPRPEELDEMLSVMCEAFHLPFGPARDVFYKDPYFDVRHKRVLLADGRIVSCLTVVDSPLRIGRAVLPVAGVAGVATRLAARNNGYATTLMRQALPDLATEGFGIAALFAISPGFYKRMGWESASSQVRMTLSPSALCVSREGRFVRAALPSDMPDLLRLYDDWSAERTGCRLRDDKRWRYLCEHVKFRFVFKRQRVEGYILFDMREGDRNGVTLRLLEFVAESEAAQRGLQTHLAQHTECDQIEYTSGWKEVAESGLLRSAGVGADELAAAGSLHLVQGPLVQMVSLETCLRALRSNWEGFDGRVTLAVKARPGDRSAFENVTIAGCGGELVVRRAVSDENPRQRVEGDSRAWAAVVCGQMSLADAIALGRLRATTEAVAARTCPLFPRRDLSIPTADHF